MCTMLALLCVFGCGKKNDSNGNTPTTKTTAQKLAAAGQFVISALTLTPASTGSQVTLQGTDNWVGGVVFNYVAFNANGTGQISNPTDGTGGPITFTFSITTANGFNTLNVNFPASVSFSFNAPLTIVTNSNGDVTGITILIGSPSQAEDWSYKGTDYNAMEEVLKVQ